jgi:cytochrome P450
MTVDRPTATGFDHGDPDVIPHLHQTLADLRERCPVGWSDNYGGFWTFTRYDDVVRAARDHTHYTVTEGITIPPTGGTIRLAPAMYDPPEHSGYRKIEMPFFSLTAVQAVEDMIRGCVRECFDKFVSRGSADLVAEVADPVPPLVLARYLGLDSSYSEEMRRLMVDFLSSARTSQDEKMVAARALEEFVIDQVESRVGGSGTDTLSRIVNTRTDDGEPLDPVVVVGMVRLMISAGHETTVHGIGSLCYRVLTEPGVRERLLASPELRKAAVLEAMRMDPPVMHMARTVVDDHELRGQRLRKGDKVMVCYGAANRDPAKFAEPDRFDLDRGLAAHVTFGSGRHRCLGEHLAVVELGCVLDELLARIPDVALPEDFEVVWTGGGLTRGVKSLPVTFTPERR